MQEKQVEADSLDDLRALEALAGGDGRAAAYSTTVKKANEDA